MNTRLYSCNRGFNTALSLLIIATCAFSLTREGLASYQQYVAIAAGIITLLWGGYFLWLYYEVNEQGIYKRLLGKRGYKWAEITELQLDELDEGGRAYCRVHVHTAQGRVLTLSSDILGLDGMEQLVTQLREAGHLPPLPPEQEESSEANEPQDTSATSGDGSGNNSEPKQ